MCVVVFLGGIHLAVAGDVFDGVLFCALLFPLKCLGDLRLN